MMKDASHRLFDRDLSEPLKPHLLNLYMMELQGKSNRTRRREEWKKLVLDNSQENKPKLFSQALPLLRWHIGFLFLHFRYLSF